jgi:hypothetical protein
MDRAVFGEAVAKTMDRLDKLESAGELAGFVLDEVLVVAVFTKPYEDRNQDIEPDAIEELVFVDGSVQKPHVQVGILTMALDTTRKLAD